MGKMLCVNTFGGLDERNKTGDNLALSPAMRNFRVTENRTLEKRYGRSPVCPAPAAIDGLWSGFLGSERMFLFVSDGTLFRLYPETSERVEIGEVGTGETVLFEFRHHIYIKNADKYSRYDGATLTEVTGYAPLVAIGCAADGSGSSFEDTNLLTGKKRVLFSADGSSTVYHLPEQALSSVDGVKLDGETITISWTADTETGTVTFASAVPEGVNNLEIAYDTGRDRKSVILDASGVMLFGGDTDGHLFLWGNPDYPAYRFHSELADGLPSAEYFPENNYTVIGDTLITDIIAQYDRQLIFTKDRAYYSYCELQKDLLGNVYASFPVYNLNGEKGSLLQNAGCIMENEPVTLCADGLNRWESTSVENERNAVCFSHPVGETLKSWITSGNFGAMRLFNLRTDGELYFVKGQTALIYNYRLGAWYAYDNFGAEKMCEYDGKLYFSNGAGIEFLDPDSAYDPEGRFTCYMETPMSALGLLGRRKKLTEIGMMLYASATPVLELSYTDEEGGAFPVTTRVEHYCGDGKTVGISFRPPLFRLPAVKLRLTEYDYAHCEICELHLVAVQKGKYGRTGL